MTDRVAGEERWLVILGGDGVVAAVAGGAPSSWVGLTVDQLEQLPSALRDEARALVERVRNPDCGAVASKGHVLLDVAGSPTLEMVAIEGMLLRRAATDLRRVLPAAMEMVTHQAAGLEIDFRIEVSDEVPAEVWVDPEKIAWAVTTLVGSALRYVRRGTRRMPGGSIRVRLSFEDARKKMVISVQDDGPGIPAERMPELLKRGSNKAGLALILIQDVVIAHGGKMEIQSSTDRFEHGTTVTLRIPVQ